MPAVAGLRKQGASKGAALAFLISTPETGVDSIALSYSLLGPVIAAIRPIAAFVTGLVAGIIENVSSGSSKEGHDAPPNLSCSIDGCCDGQDCDPKDHAAHHTFYEKIRAGVRFAFDDLMSDLAVWFLAGIVLAGLISVLVPATLVTEYLGSGLLAYLAMLVVSLPMYVCASMSTPVAAALMLKGSSPGVIMVLMLAGPATNAATMTVVGGLLGKRTLAIYLGTIVACTLLFAFVTDLIFDSFSLHAAAGALAAGGELLPGWLEWGAAILLAAFIVRVVWTRGPRKLLTQAFASESAQEEQPAESVCTSETCSGDT
ncbi:MAG: SO_0444 family Cu/Zn efflux transporter [Thermodesulfobacteriota bacterium]